MILRKALRLGSPRFTTATSNSLRNLISYFSSAALTPRPSIKPDSGEESVVYRESGKFARPATVTLSERLNNSVNLIGTVEYLPKKFDLKDGKVGCYTLLLVKPSSNSHHNFRVTLSMWALLAEKALAHLKPNDYIYVSGQLGSFTKEGEERLYYRVTVRELNYVEVPDENYQVVAKSESESDVFREDKIRNRLRLWELLFSNPDEWYDKRKTKKSPRHPDFKHKTSGEALWLSKDDPPSLLGQLELLDSRLELNRLRLFQTLFANPDEWYDRRKTKKNPRQPDFVHKTTGEALWLNEDDPPSLLAQLELLDSRLDLNRLRLFQTLFANPDEWYDKRKTKKNPRQPDFKHKTTGEALWLNEDDPPSLLGQLELLDSGSESDVFGEDKIRNRLRLWELLFANPDEWYDNRKTKKSPGHPDFKHKTTGEALWLSKDDPPWLLEQLELLDSRLELNRLRLFQTLFANPDEWYDNRKTKKNPRQPDFVHKSSGEALWLNEDDPPSLLGLLELVDSRLELNRLRLFQTLFANPDEWYDKRETKKNPRQPDFVHKTTGEALWLNEDDPPSLLGQLELYDSRLELNRLHLFQTLFGNPDEWYDKRKTKKNPRQPDFKHKTTGEVLWLNEDDPPSLLGQLELLDSRSESDVSREDKLRNRLHLWQILLFNPDEWYDNRKKKKNPSSPDFKHKSTGEALWLRKDDPPWLLRQLELLDSRLSKKPSDGLTFGSWV